MNFKFVFAIMLSLFIVVEAKVPPQVKKSVVFIFSKDTSNRLIPQGTAFFVLMSSSRNADSANFGYLVTTRATLTSSTGRIDDSLFVRINRKDGYSDTLIVPMYQDGQPRYFFHTDSTVDLAVIPAYPDMNRYDFLYTPAGMIAPIDFFSKEDVGEGDEVFHVGMFSSHLGIFKNMPMIRYGRISQISQEKYRTEYGFTELYLVETGISNVSKGSPLYLFSTEVKDSSSNVANKKFFLAGIISGEYGDGTSERGLVKVVPAYKLSELLNVPAVQMEREKEFEKMKVSKSKKELMK